jgi:hypothetical protein
MPAFARYNPHYPNYPLDAPPFAAIMEDFIDTAKAFRSNVLLSWG